MKNEIQQKIESMRPDRERTSENAYSEKRGLAKRLLRLPVPAFRREKGNSKFVPVPYFSRIKDFDYSSPSDYFITICSHNRECIFGEIVDGEMILNELGKIVEKEILNSSDIRKELDIDIFSIMPNHIHLIVSLDDFYYDPVGANGRSPLQCDNESLFKMKPKSISSFVSGFKSTITKQINILQNTPHQPVFQRNYYEHIIHN